MVKEKSKDGGSNDLKADWKDPKEYKLFVSSMLLKSKTTRGK